MTPPSGSPPVPAHGPSPTPKKKMPVWVIVLIVAGACGLCVVPEMVGAVAVMVPAIQERQKRLTCMTQLSELSQLHLARTVQSGTERRPLSGSALWLSLRAEGSISPGNERILLCPGDPHSTPPPEPSVYDAIDLANAPRELCSYAGRDFEAFPLSDEAVGQQVLGACIHHRSGAIVVYDDGRTEFVDHLELGITEDDEKTVGPESKSPLLRVVRYGDGSVR